MGLSGPVVAAYESYWPAKSQVILGARYNMSPSAYACSSDDGSPVVMSVQGEAPSPRVEQRIEESVKLIAREFAPRVAVAVRSQKKNVPAATAYLSGQLSREYPHESTLNEAKRGPAQRSEDRVNRVSLSFCVSLCRNRPRPASTGHRDRTRDGSCIDLHRDSPGSLMNIVPKKVVTAGQSGGRCTPTSFIELAHLERIKCIIRKRSAVIDLIIVVNRRWMPGVADASARGTEAWNFKWAPERRHDATEA